MLLLGNLKPGVFMNAFKCLITVMLAAPIMAFAQDATYCYKATTAVPSSVPSVLCLEKISLGPVNTLSIISRDGSVPAEVEVTKFSRHTQEKFAFVAESVIVDESGPTHCSAALNATLTIAGSSLMNTIYPDRLNVSVSLKISNDVCHHDPMPEVISYVLVK
jgi:hypothetical protein